MSRTRASAKAAGTRFESQIAAYLALQSVAEARGLHRMRDLLETARSQEWIVRRGQA